MHHVLIYTSVECCLCDAAKAVIAPFCATHGVTVEEIDITGNEALEGRFGETVPVIYVDGKKRFVGKVDPMLFRRLLAAGGSGAQS